MALSAKAKGARTVNKREREARRDEIQARWDRRVTNRWFAERKPATVEAEVGLLLEGGQWAPYEDLLEYIAPEVYKALLVYLLRVIELKEMPYDEYLQTPEWKEKAENAKRRWGGNCALNADHPAEHAHHRTYARRGRERAADLIGLCADCHARFHGK